MIKMGKKMHLFPIASCSTSKALVTRSFLLLVDLMSLMFVSGKGGEGEECGETQRDRSISSID